MKEKTLENSKNPLSIRDCMKTAIEQLELKKNKDGLTGVPTGFSALDRITSGFQQSELIVVAGRPGMGKTSFLLSLARNAAVEYGQGVAIFSLEMKSVQVTNRLISAEAELESEKIRKGNLAQYEWEQLHYKIRNLESAPLFIDTTPRISLVDIVDKCRNLKNEHDIQLIIIDYIQHLTVEDSNLQKSWSNADKNKEISFITRELKQLAKELNVPIIISSQLSRSIENRVGEKRPQLSDMRDSGSLEDDADMVIFLYRPEYYGITQDENGNPTTNMGEVIIAKNRNGSLDTVQLKFIGKFTRFGDLDTGNMSPFGSAAFPDINPMPSEFETPPGTITLGSRPNPLYRPKLNNPPDDTPPF